MDTAQDKTYRIGQAAKLLGVKAYVLRFWESEFDRIQPIRTSSGQRLYTEQNLEVVRRIKHLLYDKGLTIDGARKALEEDTRHDFLIGLRDELHELRGILLGKEPATDPQPDLPLFESE